MLFDNKKFKIIALSAFYGAFLIAAIIPLVMCLCNMEADGNYLNNLMSLFLGFILLALPYLHFLKSDFFENGVILSVLNILSAIIINVAIFFTLFSMAGALIGETELGFKQFCLASFFMASFSIMMYNSKDEWFFLTDNVGYFVIVLIFPVFLGLSYLLCAFFSDYALIGIACGFYMCCTMIKINLSSLITSILLLLSWLLLSGLNYEKMLVAENPLNILAFLPALLTVFYVIYVVISMKVAAIKDDDNGRLIHIISISVSSLALTVAQCFVVNTWWIVLVVLAAVLLANLIIDLKLGGVAVKSSSSASYSGGGSSYGGGSGSSSKSGGGGTRSINYAQAAEDVCRKFNYKTGSEGQFYYNISICSYDRSSTYGGNHYEFKVTVDFRPMRSDLKDYEIKCSVNEAQTFCRSLMKDIGNEASRRGLNAEVSVKPNFNI